MNIAALVHYVSSLLNDQETGNEFLTWDESLVTEAVHEAIAAVAHATPQSFIVSGTHTVTPGVSQAVPPERRELFSVNAQICGEAPFIVRNTGITQVDTDAITSGGECQSCGGRSLFVCNTPDPCGAWKLNRWAWNAARPYELLLSPAPPNDGVARTLEVSWLGPTHVDGETALTDKWKPAVVAFAMYRLYSVDIESASHQAKSKDSFAVFSALIGGGQQPQ